MAMNDGDLFSFAMAPSKVLERVVFLSSRRNGKPVLSAAEANVTGQ